MHALHGIQDLVGAMVHISDFGLKLLTSFCDLWLKVIYFSYVIHCISLVLFCKGGPMGKLLVYLHPLLFSQCEGSGNHPLFVMWWRAWCMPCIFRGGHLISCQFYRRTQASRHSCIQLFLSIDVFTDGPMLAPFRRGTPFRLIITQRVHKWSENTLFISDCAVRACRHIALFRCLILLMRSSILAHLGMAYITSSSLSVMGRTTTHGSLDSSLAFK